MRRKEVYEEIINDLRNNKLSLFCGGGISFNPPSSIPTATIIRKGIVSGLFPQQILASMRKSSNNLFLYGEDIREKEYLNMRLDLPFLSSPDENQKKQQKRAKEQNRYYQFEQFLEDSEEKNN